MADADEVCRAFRNNGKCRYNDECKFAHTDGDFIEPPPRGLCFNFQQDGECSFGDRCRFLHGEEDDRFERREAEKAERKAAADLRGEGGGDMGGEDGVKKKKKRKPRKPREARGEDDEGYDEERQAACFTRRVPRQLLCRGPRANLSTGGAPLFPSKVNWHTALLHVSRAANTRLRPACRAGFSHAPPPPPPVQGAQAA